MKPLKGNTIVSTALASVLATSCEADIVASHAIIASSEK